MKTQQEEIEHIIKCMQSDLYSYQEFMDDMVEKEGSIENFLMKHNSSFEEWKEWFSEN